MDTTGVAGSTGYNLPKAERVPKKTLDKNDFLNLLIAQLKNQDPLEPQSNDQFIATMAQFNSLETMSSLDNNAQYSQAMAMVGKQVTVEEPGKDPLQGIVEKAGISDGKVVVTIGGAEYSLADVKEVGSGETVETSSAPGDLLQAALLIGKEVMLSGSSGGVVEKVGVADGKIKVYIGGTPYDISSISEIGEPATAVASQPAGG